MREFYTDWECKDITEDIKTWSKIPITKVREVNPEYDARNVKENINESNLMYGE